MEYFIYKAENHQHAHFRYMGFLKTGSGAPMTNLGALYNTYFYGETSEAVVEKINAFVANMEAKKNEATAKNNEVKKAPQGRGSHFANKRWVIKHTKPYDKRMVALDVVQTFIDKGYVLGSARSVPGKV